MYNQSNVFLIKLTLIIRYLQPILAITTAAVSCSPSTYVLGADGIGILVDGQAGPCMGRCISGACVILF